VRHPRFHCNFTPTYSSWINLVERWFAELTTKWLRRGTHRSTKELESSITDWVERWNKGPNRSSGTRVRRDLDTLASTACAFLTRVTRRLLNKLDLGVGWPLQVRDMSDRSAGTERVEVGHPGGQSPNSGPFLTTRACAPDLITW